MSNMRMGPWDLKRELWDQMEFLKKHDGKTWRYMLTEACRLYIASRGLVPHAPVERKPVGLCAHANIVDSVPVLPVSINSAVVPAVGVPASVSPAVPAVGVPAAPGVPAVGVPAVVVPAPELTEAEQFLARLKRTHAWKAKALADAHEELKTDPQSKRANNLILRLPPAIASYEADIAAATKQVEAERAAKENSGEAANVGEV